MLERIFLLARKRMRNAVAVAAITFARWPNASNFASWARKANCRARSSLFQAQERWVLACCGVVRLTPQ